MPERDASGASLHWLCTIETGHVGLVVQTQTQKLELVVQVNAGSRALAT